MFRIPSKPHFFQPLYPGFEDKFLIPVSFFNYLKKGQECKEVLLRSQRGKLCPVKINGRLFEDGWKEFVKDHELEIGDFLVFRHEGDLAFDVMVFDRSMCEKEYVPFTHVKEEQVEIEIDLEEVNVPEDSTAGKKVEMEKELEKKKNLEMGKKKKIQMEKELEKQKKLEMEKELEEGMRMKSRSNYPKAKAANSSVLEHPNCVIKLTHDSMKKSRMYVAKNLAKKLGLPSRSCSIILKDEEEKCFPAQLLYNDVKKNFFIGSGWGYFRVLHKFKAGESLILEMIQNGGTPVIKMRREKFEEGKKVNTKSKAKASCSVHEQNDPEYSPTPIAKKLEKEKELEKQKKIQMEKELEKQKVQMEKELEEEMRMKSRSNPPKAKAAKSSILEHPNCVIKLTHDSMKKSRMYIGGKFARKLGLPCESCSIILKDEEENCLPAKILYNDVNRKFYIGSGWSYFRAIHKLKAGDSLFLEYIQNEDTPVIKIRKVQEHQAPEVAKEIVSGKSKASSSTEVQKRFFVAKVTKRTTSTSRLYIPLKFSRLHFENTKSCEVNLIDLKGRSWSAHLWNNGSDEQSHIADGWNEFQVANNLNPGDSFIFEFIENPKKPVFKMCGFKGNDKAAFSSMEKPRFYVTVQVSHMKTFQMKVPKKFASMSGLDRSKGVLIKKEIGKSWLVLTRLDNNNKVYMTTGWIEFLEENELEEGDVFMLELVKAGTVPEMKYYAFK